MLTEQEFVDAIAARAYAREAVAVAENIYKLTELVLEERQGRGVDEVESTHYRHIKDDIEAARVSYSLLLQVLKDFNSLRDSKET